MRRRLPQSGSADLGGGDKFSYKTTWEQRLWRLYHETRDSYVRVCGAWRFILCHRGSTAGRASDQTVGDILSARGRIPVVTVGPDADDAAPLSLGPSLSLDLRDERLGVLVGVVDSDSLDLAERERATSGGNGAAVTVRVKNRSSNSSRPRPKITSACGSWPCLIRTWYGIRR